MQSPIMERFPVEVVQHSSLSTPPNTDMVAFTSSTACNGSQQEGMLQVQCTLGGDRGVRLGRKDHRSNVDSITHFTKKDYSTGPRKRVECNSKILPSSEYLFPI